MIRGSAPSRNLLVAAAVAALAGCATSQSADIAEMPLEDRSSDIVIASDGRGLGASWVSVTESQLTRTATELSNLGGTPVVLGAVGVIMAADAAPRRRAGRIADSLNAGIDPDALDQDLAGRIGAAVEAALPDGTDAPDVRIKAFDRRADYRNEGFIIRTDYALSRDGSALRVTAEITHADLELLETEIRREIDRLGLQQDGFVTRGSSRRLRQMEQQWQAMAPQYRRRIVWHSDPLMTEPVPHDTPTDPELQAAILDALDMEREAREAAAQSVHDDAMSTAETERQISRADRKLDRALDRAASRFDRAAEKAADDTVDKAESLLMAVNDWHDSQSPGGETPLSAALDEAHAYIAERVVGVDAAPQNSDEPEEDAATRTRPDIRLSVPGAELLEQYPDGRMVVLILQGEEAGTVLSLPEEGPAEYGHSAAYR